MVGVLYELTGTEFFRKKGLSIYSTKSFLVSKKVLLILLHVINTLFVINSTYHPFIYFQF